MLQGLWVQSARRFPETHAHCQKISSKFRSTNYEHLSTSGISHPNFPHILPLLVSGNISIIWSHYSPYSFPIDTWPPPHPSFLSRSRSSLSRLRKASQSARKRDNRTAKRNSSGSLKAHSNNAIVLPSLQNNQEDHFSPTATSPAETAPVEDSSSIFYDSDPFRKIESPTELRSSRPPLHIVTQRPGRPPVPRRPLPATPKTPPQSPSTSTSSARRSSLPWLRAFSKARLLPSRRQSLQTQTHQDHYKETSDRRVRSSAPSPVDRPVSLAYSLPDFNFDQIDFTTIVESSPVPEESVLSISPVETAQPYPSPVEESKPIAEPEPAVELKPEPKSLVEPKLFVKPQSPVAAHAPRLRLQLPDYTCVDPRSLGVSPVLASALSRYSLSNTPIPPSPSWLSRNVARFEHSQDEQSPAPSILPPSPAPLPILPRSLLPISPPSPAPLPILPRSLLPVASPSPEPLPIPLRSRLPVITITTDFDTQVRSNKTSFLCNAHCCI